MPISTSETYIYRITHRLNLPLILKHGICNKTHVNASRDFIPIGNESIIGVRKDHQIRIKGYGNIGEYVPFYFSQYSIMLYNILTGYGVPKINPENIIFLCCIIDTVIGSGNKYFFTDGQANTAISEHFSDLADLDKVDWNVVKSRDFRKTSEDVDRTRRYQAEFLVKSNVPVNCINAIVVYNDKCDTFVKKELEKAGLVIPVYTRKTFYFNR